MNDKVIDILEEYKYKGVIDRQQFEEITSQMNDEKIKKNEEVIKFANLTIALVIVIFIGISLTIVFMDKLIIPTNIKLYTSTLFILISVFLLYRSVMENNYLKQEIYTLANWFSNIYITLSINQILQNKYGSSEIQFFVLLAMLPVVIVSDAMLTFLVISIMYVFSTGAELNFAVVSISNTMYVTALSVVFLLVILNKYKESIMYVKKGMTKENSYMSYNLQISIMEIVMVLYLYKILVLLSGGANILFIYSMYTFLLIRRSSIFDGFLQVPKYLENIVFIYSSLYYLYYKPTPGYMFTFVSLHILYYLTYLLLNERGLLKSVDNLYKIKQNFYINMMFITFVFIEFNLIKEYVNLTLLIVGLFNLYIARRAFNMTHVLISFGVTAYALINTAYTQTKLEIALYLCVFGLITLILNINSFKKGTENE